MAEKTRGVGKPFLNPRQHINQFIKKPGFVHERVLLLFWYMKPQWKRLKGLCALEQTGGYLWPHYEGKDSQGSFSIIQIPAPGMALMEMIMAELVELGGQSFLLWGSVAQNQVLWQRPTEWLWATGACRLPCPSARQVECVDYALPWAEVWPEATSSLVAKRGEKADDYRELEQGRVWCSDSPYRFGPAELDLACDYGCKAVDMESYAYFRTASDYQKTAYALYYVRDAYGAKGWSLPHRTGESGAMARFVLSIVEALPR